MATKKELIEGILALKPNAVVEDLTHAALTEMLKDYSIGAEIVVEEVQADEASVEVEEVQADEASVEVEEAPAEVEEVKAPEAPAEDVSDLFPVVAKGKSITTLKGILIAGEKILPEYLPGGVKTFKNLCEKGYISDE